MSATPTQDNTREIRKEFFAYRNGIVADKLRAADDPHSVIMGCLLADIQAIASRRRETIGDDSTLADLARQLWSDTHSRECRLAAPMLMPPRSMTVELAARWCESVESVEVADTLCHKLLRHLPDATHLCRRLIGRQELPVKYTGYRLMLNLMLLGKLKADASLQAAVNHEAETAQGPLTGLLKDIIEEF